MRPASCKQKGRTAQQEVCRALLSSIYSGLEPDDCKSTSMGVTGLDVQLSPAARKVADLAIEVKNKEALNVVTTFWEHFKKYAHKTALKLLVHRKNRTELLVTLRFSDFLQLLTHGSQPK